jgi:hypothetical protein
MPMKLKSFGCSFIFGTDLVDEVFIPGTVSPSQLTWPAHLSKHLNRDYECYAVPGSGNLQILEKILNQATISSNTDLFVIGWTWIDRFDYYDREDDNPTFRYTPWNTLRPVDNTDLANTYYKHLHAEYCDKFTCLSYVKLAIDTLDQQGIPYIMTFQDELLFDQRWHVSPSVIELQRYIKPRMTTFDGQTFVNWSRSHGHAESKTWHPLESAHQAGFELLKSNLDTILRKA